MTIINLEEFEDYDAQQLFEFLKLEEDLFFQIYIPRVNEVMTENLSGVIAMDYEKAAYCGELMASIATSFSYILVDPKICLSFTFWISVEKPRRLARLLYRLIHSFDYTDRNYDEFGKEVDLFYEEAVRRGRKMACQPLWDIAKQLSEKDLNEEL